ncbi:hypothetical protein [Flaviaesturariibacter amylovorans]|uniref:DUF904 domain-containing protein n=1 Tax=Flaviaesturariibacter amylovorans TaxID=1084520 RepID=A0ABP8HU58_9BACT
MEGIEKKLNQILSELRDLREQVGILGTDCANNFMKLEVRLKQHIASDKDEILASIKNKLDQQESLVRGIRQMLEET